MKTSELIDLLSAASQPVDTGRLARNLLACAGGALIAAMLMVVVTIGPRPDIAEAWRTPPVLLKIAFGACVALIALNLFLASLRPGSSPERRLPLITIPVAAVAMLAIAVLAKAPTDQWGDLILGRHWLGCLLLVPTYAMIPLSLFTALARRGAPVRLGMTGALAGLSSGGLAVIAYSLHCPDDTAPFLSTWYPLALAASGVAGAAILPRAARW